MARYALMSFKALILIFLLSGCGYDQTYTGENTNFTSSVTSGGSPLTDQEMAVALRICYAFRTKRTVFLAEKLDVNFNFSYQAKDCDGNLVTDTNLNTTLKQLLPDGPLSYESVSSGQPYMREVQTDTDGYLVSYCGEVLKGDTPLDVKEINNEYLEYEFLNDFYDTVIIRIGSGARPEDPTPVVKRILRYEILTNQQSSGSYLGLVNKMSQRVACDPGNPADSRFKSFEQTFIAP